MERVRSEGSASSLHLITTRRERRTMTPESPVHVYQEIDPGDYQGGRTREGDEGDDDDDDDDDDDGGEGGVRQEDCHITHIERRCRLRASFQ